MEFEIDSDTLKDLEIFSGRTGGDGISQLFQTTRTLGARDLLQKIMRTPLSDIDSLNERLEMIRHIRDHGIALELTYSQVDLVEHYLKSNKRFLRNNPIDALYDHLSNRISIKPTYYVVREGINNIIRVLKVAKKVIDESEDHEITPRFLRKEARPVLLEDEFLIRLSGLKRKLNFIEVNKLDRYFRHERRDDVRALLEFIYQLDVYESAAFTAKKPGWSLPVFRQDDCKINLKGLFHPEISNPILNDIVVGGDKHFILLTGPNMAGKSSLLKSIGLSMYLAHIGFPVPALSMETPAFKGIITTINLADNLGDGLSHYYSEIKRIKYIAQKIVEKGTLFVIIDELFRGTNPKDAVEASLLIIRGMIDIPNCVFLISTHHAEIAAEVGMNDRVYFKYMESTFVEGEPEFSFKLKDGVSDSRTGMYILEKEGVMGVLREAAGKL